MDSLCTHLEQHYIQSDTQSFLLHLQVSLCEWIQFADMQAGVHPNMGAGRRLGKVARWMRVVVQDYREELLLALAVSAVTVARPKQLRSTHPHHPLPSHPSFPSLCVAPQHQRESVARPRLSWPVGWSCCT